MSNDDKELTQSVIPKKSIELAILTDKQELEVVGDVIFSYLTDALSIVVPPLSVINRWNEKREEKKQAEVIKKLKEQVSKQTKDIANVSNLLKNPKGFVLFNKIIYLVRSIEIEDEDFSQYTELLSKVLINISNKDFENLFSEISYAISCVERLSPQAIFLLSDSVNWPKGSVGGTTTSDVTLSGNWLEITTNEYIKFKDLDRRFASKISHTFSELDSGGYMKVSSDKKIKKTKLGEDIYNFLLNNIQ